MKEQRGGRRGANGRESETDENCQGGIKHKIIGIAREVRTRSASKRRRGNVENNNQIFSVLYLHDADDGDDDRDDDHMFKAM